MRRCPVCDFIYEDDDKLCAMDGTGLVNHSGPLPFEGGALPQSAAPAVSHGSGLTLIAAGIILSIALFLYFHNIARRNVLPSHQQGAARTYDPSRPVDQKPIVITPVESATPFTTPSPTLNPTPPKTDAQPRSRGARKGNDNDVSGAVPVEAATPLPRPVPSLPMRAKIEVPSDVFVSSPVKPNLDSRPAATPQKENQKKDSQITSFLKKAGRLLKKPFKN